MDWFLYDREFRHESIKLRKPLQVSFLNHVLESYDACNKSSI